MPRGLVGLALNGVERRLGVTVMPQEQALELREAALDRRSLAREHELLGYTALSALGMGDSPDPPAQDRRAMGIKARLWYQHDPMVQGVVRMRTNFVLGRGVPRPRAKDPDVQKKIDEAWDDLDNKAVLTSYDAQVALCTDLILQSNFFYTVFTGDGDGKVKLGTVDFDTVIDVVPDPEAKQHALYYLTQPVRVKWDYRLHRLRPDKLPGMQRYEYLEHWANIEAAEDAGRQFEKPPEGMVGDGKVYHVRVNRASSKAHFGTPEFQSQARWYGAYNDLMKARVDMIKAVASLFLRRKLKGTKRQLEQMAGRALSRTSWLQGLDVRTGEDMVAGPTRGAAMLHENEAVQHEQIKLDSGAANALTDAQMVRAQISAGSGLPQHYLGDPTGTALATAASLELPVLKTTEAMQQVLEDLFRWFLDLVIEKAVDSGQLSEERGAEDVAGKKVTPGRLTEAADRANAKMEAKGITLYPRHVAPMSWPDGDRLVTEPTLVLQDEEGTVYYERITEAHEGQVADEEETKRDLSYEFKIPSPLRRTLPELVGAAIETAQGLDPNGTNIDLTRFLANIIFGEGFEIDNPASAVEEIWPDGYQDPALAAMQAQGQPPGGNLFGPEAAGQPVPTMDELQQQADNPLGAKQTSSAAAPEKSGYIKSMQQAVVRWRKRGSKGAPGELVEIPIDLPQEIVESAAYAKRLTDVDRNTPEAEIAEGEDDFAEVVLPVLQAELDRLHLAPGEEHVSR